MSRLEEAQRKLETALSRLDAAVERRVADSAPGDAAAAADAELAAVRAENDRLQGTTNAVAAQLDRTIERLQRLLRD